MNCHPQPAASPIRIELDNGNSLKAFLTDIFEEAKRRQRENRGSNVLGIVMLHLVGAKLEMLYPEGTIKHGGFSVADFPAGRSGDFEVGDCVIHVTTVPSKTLLSKCQENLDKNLRPLVVSTAVGTEMTEALADEFNISNDVEVLDIIQFLVANMLEWTGFNGSQRRHTFEELITRYNAIVEACETDPSLKIEVA